MNADFDLKFVFDWKLGVGEYVVIKMSLSNDECQPAKVIAALSTAAGGAAEWLRQKGKVGGTAAVIAEAILGVLTSYSVAIVKANRGSGVMATLEFPLVAVGVPRFTAEGKFANMIVDAYDGTFSELWIDVSDSAITESVTADGWRRLLVDLNRGAKGKYLYVLLKPDSQDCISDIIVQADRKKGNALSGPAGYTPIEVDLNLGCGKETDYIYSFFRKGGLPIRGISVVAGSERELPVPDGFRMIDVDLNRGAHGNFIYLCVK